jgi:hypothetical protein
MSSRGFPRKPETLDNLLNAREAQARYGVTKWVLYSQAALGKLHAVRRGDEGRVYYLESEIQALINRSCYAAA